MKPIVFAAALMAVSAPARAQDPSGRLLATGDTLRVWALTPELSGSRGVVKRQVADTVVLSVRSARSRTWLDTPIARHHITRMDVRDGNRRSAGRAASGLLVGAVLGGVAGGYLGYSFNHATCNSDECDNENWRMANSVESGLAGILVGAVGGLAGSVIGWRIGGRPVQQWRRIYP